MKTATRPEEQSSRAHGQHITTSSRTVSMSSREIAELTGKQHKDVTRDIRVMLEALRKDGADLRHVREDKDARGYTKNFHLNRELTEVLILGYSISLRLKVIRRLHELEDRQASAVAIPDFNDPAASARAWADQYDQRILLAAIVEEQAIKIDALQNLFKEGMSPVQFCKGLNGVNVMQICKYLKSRDWLFNESKTGTRWRVASYARDLYMTEHQQQITPHGKEPFIHHTPILLRKGAERLFERYLKGELPMKKTWDGQFTHDKALATQLGQQQEGGAAE